MKASWIKCMLAAVLFAVIVPATTAQAGVWGDVARGFEAFGYQISGERNYLGNGWDVNLNTVYSGQNYNFGFAELTLGEGTAVPSNISLGYSLRGIPSAQFSWNTGGVALPYTFKINNGIQDFSTLNGSVLIDVSTDINVLGFYDTKVQISNRAQYETDGFLAAATGDLNFDLGPINVSGNIYADALAAITQPFFTAAGTENPFAKFSSKAAKSAELDATIDQLRARIAAGEVLSDEEMSKLVNSTLLSAILTGDASQTQFLGELLGPSAKNSTTTEATLRLVDVVPEPTTLLLLLGPTALLMRRRK